MYSWEKTFGNATYEVDSSRKWLLASARKMAKLYKVTPPSVIFHDPTGSDCAGWSRPGGLICLKKSGHGRNLWTLVHEMAHHIISVYGHRNIHSPRWLGVYMYLMAYTRLMPLSASIPSARHHGLKFYCPLKRCSPETLKRYLYK